MKERALIATISAAQLGSLLPHATVASV